MNAQQRAMQIRSVFPTTKVTNVSPVFNTRFAKELLNHCTANMMQYVRVTDKSYILDLDILVEPANVNQGWMSGVVVHFAADARKCRMDKFNTLAAEAGKKILDEMYWSQEK